MTVLAQLRPDKAAGSDCSATQLLLSLGMEGLHASVMDVESMACLSSWRIGDAGERSTAAEDAGGPSFPTAMATIVHLNGTPLDQTLTRQLDAHNWAFAWRVDASSVAVAEARYGLPNNACTDRDTAVVRQLCSAGTEAGKLRRTEAMPDRLPQPASQPLAAAAPHRTALPPTPVSWADKLAQPLRWPSLLALGLTAAVCLAAALQIQSSREGEARRLRQLTDATMTQQLTRVLALGDYGEVQGNLDTFEGLGYFKGAAVIDARRRPVAMAGAVPALRIGRAVAGPEVAGARTVPLLAEASNTEGQLLIWGPETPSPRVSVHLETTLFMAGLLLMLATLAGAALLGRGRLRQREADANQPLVLPPLPETPP
jgi:hypothetical protein